MSPIDIFSFLFDFYIWVVLLRFLLQLTRADFYNPLSQFCVKLTQPVLAPLRRVIPSLGGLDVSSFLFAYVLVMVKITLLNLLGEQGWPSLFQLLYFGFFHLTLALLQLLFFLILGRAILSWVDPYGHSPMMLVLTQITNPLLKPLRRAIPPIGGIDLSPMFLLLLIMLLRWMIERLMLGLYF